MASKAVRREPTTWGYHTGTCVLGREFYARRCAQSGKKRRIFRVLQLRCQSGL